MEGRVGLLLPSLSVPSRACEAMHPCVEVDWEGVVALAPSPLHAACGSHGQRVVGMGVVVVVVLMQQSVVRQTPWVATRVSSSLHLRQRHCRVPSPPSPPQQQQWGWSYGVGGPHPMDVAVLGGCLGGEGRVLTCTMVGHACGW